MHVDFWNNPLVISALRLRYRRGSPGMIAALYLSVLLCVGAGLHYYQAEISVPFPVIYLVVILGLQFVLSAAIAMLTVASSISTEVTQRTLDFQRIVALAPRQILLGKMLGEPATSYLLALATLPLAVLCWHWGAASLLTIVLLYVNLVTATLMCAAVGLIHPLVPPAEKAGVNSKGSGSAAQVLVAMAFFFGLQAMIVQGRAVLENSLAAALLGSFTPVPAFWGLLEGSAWRATVPLWGFGLPSLLVAPVVQLVVTLSIVTAMSRKLRNPLNPSLTKPLAYALLTVVDLFVASLLYSSWFEGFGFERATAVFYVAHLATALLLVSLVTPSQDVLMTWIWRLRGRTGWARDGWLLDRSPNLLVLVTLATIGVLVYFVGFVAPVAATGNVPLGGGPPRGIAPPVITATVLLLSLGTLFQCISALVRRGATIALFCLVVMLFVGPPLTASLLGNAVSPERYAPLADTLMGLSPLAHFAAWIVSLEHVPMLRVDMLARSLPLMLACYTALFVLSLAALSRWLGDRQAVVAGKLAEMKAGTTDDRRFVVESTPVDSPA